MSSRPPVQAKHATTQIPGHGLRAEGKPDGLYSGTRTGRGVCSCGAKSEVLQSDTSRKRWHVQHKADVATEQASAAGLLCDGCRDAVSMQRTHWHCGACSCCPKPTPMATPPPDGGDWQTMCSPA